MKTITEVNNGINDAVVGVVSSESNRFDVFLGTTDETLLNIIKDGKLVAKEDFNKDEQEAWNAIFENYISLLEDPNLYEGLSISDDDDGNRYYYLIW